MALCGVRRRLFHMRVWSSRLVLKDFQQFSLTATNSVLGPQARPVPKAVKVPSQPVLKFQPKTALILSKTSRFQFEKMRCENESELKETLALRGSDYDRLLLRHQVHVENLEKIVNSLKKAGFETKVIQREDYSDSLIDWADMVVSAGGDGTFLLAASKITNSGKPLIGYNTDPATSEGLLCMPKKMTDDCHVAVSRLLSGRFRWRILQRIRTTLTGNNKDLRPVNLHDQQMHIREPRFLEDVGHEQDDEKKVKDQPSYQKTMVLPFLALNEVFLGESLSARTSYFEMSVDQSPMVKQKSSGLTVSTGTGSTSWHFSINRISPAAMKDILAIVGKESQCNINIEDVNMVARVAQTYNSSLRFDPSSPQMAYTVRDAVSNATYTDCYYRGFGEHIKVRSRCWDACVVLDGSISYPFNDGAVAVLSIHEEDGLRTVDFS